MAATETGVWTLQEVRDKQLASEWSYTATGDAGSLFSMGYNNGGDLGQNNRTKYSSPVQIPGTWKDVGGVKSDGTLWSWGYNGIGGLGQNDLVHRSSPVQIGSGTDWYEAYGLIDNANTEKECLAIKTNGTLWAWGYNHNGQLGLNNRTNYSSPTQVGAATDWLTSGHNKFGWSANYQSAGVVKANGTMWVWGMNWMGTLGQNSETYFSSPVQLPGTTWKGISRGMRVGMGGTKTDGTMWVWGEGAGGMLGQNSIADGQEPLQIPGAGINIRGDGSVTHIVKEA